ncbi:glycoside hydrolase family 25 protein [Ethanoligenens sp.]|uniref:glycoside hydrolase family 25 protein n=1 Tax=Ethanoligenens sp. TaxID=2099655 RepID=UPI0039E8BA2A
MRNIFKHAVTELLAVALLIMPVWAATPSNGTASYHGVDIYHGDSENGQIDWDRLTQTQNFVYIKASEGALYVDPMYAANVAAAKACGMAWGTYHFLRLYSADNARRQADNYWARIKDTGYTLIPAVDVESYDGQTDAPAMRDIVRAFITEFESVSGVTPVLYTYTSYANNILRGQFSDCPLWLADYRGYAGNMAGWGKWDAWQYSEHGKIAAIANDEVDLDDATMDIYWNSSVAQTLRCATAVPSYDASDYYEVSSLPQVANSRAGMDFYIRDSAGNRIGNHQIDAGDPLIILGVDYDRQLAEVLYPNYAAGGWYHGYIANDEAHLHNAGYRQWKNGRMDEPTYTESGACIGSICPHERATILKRCPNGRTLILYNTSKGGETKNGYVLYPGK